MRQLLTTLTVTPSWAVVKPASAFGLWRKRMTANKPRSRLARFGSVEAEQFKSDLPPLWTRAQRAVGRKAGNFGCRFHHLLPDTHGDQMGESVHRFNRSRVKARSMPLLPPLHCDGIFCFSKNILRWPRQNCLFAKGFDARPVNAAHANDRSNDSASDNSAYEPPYPNTKERANFLFRKPERTRATVYFSV